MGARRVGHSASTVIPGRMLPLMRFDLVPPESSGTSPESTVADRDE
jgi:hypothetical protein